MKYSFGRIFFVLLIISVLFQLLLGWDEFARDWAFRLWLRKLSVAVAVAFFAAGVVVLFHRPDSDDDE